MLKKESTIRKVTTTVYIFIFLTLIFLSYQLMTSSNFPITQIGIKGEYENINKRQINLIKNKFINENFLESILNLQDKLLKNYLG